LLKLVNVEVHYLQVIYVLRGVNVEVQKGSIVALLGANGAGKSTTLKAISGLLKTEEGKVTDGYIEFDGQRIDRLDPEEIVKRGVVQVQEGRKVLQHLTIEENLLLGAYTRSDRAKTKRDLDMVYNYFPPLTQLARHTSGYCSGGEQQMLVIGRALMASPRLVLVDEPSLGLSPLLTNEIFKIMERIQIEQQVSILLVEQNARKALNLADYGYVMENGRIVLDGPTAALRENEDVKEFYLGLTAMGKKSYHEVKHYKRRKRWLG
jgi:branched-chain amino acid transport system ATP-binding protein